MQGTSSPKTLQKQFSSPNATVTKKPFTKFSNTSKIEEDKPLPQTPSLNQNINQNQSQNQTASQNQNQNHNSNPFGATLRPTNLSSASSPAPPPLPARTEGGNAPKGPQGTNPNNLTPTRRPSVPAAINSSTTPVKLNPVSQNAPSAPGSVRSVTPGPAPPAPTTSTPAHPTPNTTNPTSTPQPPPITRPQANSFRNPVERNNSSPNPQTSGQLSQKSLFEPKREQSKSVLTPHAKIEAKVIVLGEGKMFSETDDNSSTQIVLPQGDVPYFTACGVNNTFLIGGRGLYGVGIGGEGTPLDKQYTTPHLLNFKFEGKPKVVSVGNYHVIVLTDTGHVYTWGSNQSGQLGLGDSAVHSPTPKLLKQFKNAKLVAAGSMFSLVVSEFGELFGFGSNQQGQIGQGSLLPVFATPERIKQLRNVSTVSCASSRCMALTGKDQDSRVWQWGLNGSDMKNPDIQNVPTEIHFLRGKNVSQISCGDFNNLALTRFGQVFWWKGNGGPSRVVGLSGVSMRIIEVNGQECVGVDDSGVLYIWGDQNHSNKPSRDPSDLDTSGAVYQISCNNAINMAVLVDNCPKRMMWSKMLKTERKYLLSLSIMINFYYKTINVMDEESNAHKFSNEMTSSIFSNLIDIFNIQLEFCRSLDKIITDSFTAIEIENAFLRLVEEKLESFSQYIYYADNYANAATILQNERTTNLKFNSFLETQKKDAEIAYGKKVPEAALSTRSSNPTGTLGRNSVSQSTGQILSSGSTGTITRMSQLSIPPKINSSRFELRTLLIQPIKQIARYVKFLEDILKLDARSSLKVYLDYFSRLLCRLCENIELVDPKEILQCRLNDFGMPILASSDLGSLVQRLTSHLFNDAIFTESFLLTYKLFTTPDKLLSLLRDRFNLQKPFSLSVEEFEKEKEAVQQRVISVIKQWASSSYCSCDFETDPTTKNTALKLIDEWIRISEKNKTSLLDLKKTIENKNEVPVVVECNSSDPSSLASSKESDSHTPSPAKAHGHIQTNSMTDLPGRILAGGGILRNKLSRKNNKSADIQPQSVHIIDFDLKAIAEYLCMDDFNYFLEIHPREFLGQSWTKENKEELCPNVVKMTKRWNDIANWISFEIISQKETSDRVNVWTFLVKLAKELKAMRNFYGMAAVICGLTNASVNRLKKTYQKLSPGIQSTYEEYQEMLAGEGNFKLLRKVTLHADPPSIPVFAIIMKDLIYLDEVFENKMENGDINFYKYRKISEIIQNTVRYQQTPYPETIPYNSTLDQYITSTLKTASGISEKGLYTLSKQWE